MLSCSKCGQFISEGESHCPTCARPLEASMRADAWRTRVEPRDLVLDDSTEHPLVPIARFRNVAEAGYFANELSNRHAITTTLTTNEDFDALSGYWNSQFVLSVPEPMSETARLALQSLIEAADSDDVFDSNLDENTGTDRTASDTDERTDRDWQTVPDTSFSDFTTDHSVFDERSTILQDVVVEDSNVNWVPIMLTLAVGTVAFWAARRVAFQPDPAVMAAPAKHQQFDFWDELSQEPAPWTQRIRGGPGTRQMLIDSKRNSVIIREDLDGDGDFETETSFRRHAAKR